ncbi:hypothetical protein QFZ99_004665 [Paraburkholderia atlantica]|uniref:gamma-glutamylcyclotransferase n=1 Tax=Paraburkholderia atlantica TaxID=2654982 RepID=UPI003D1E45D1
MIFGRGTPHEPGAMLRLDRGGACNGLLHRIDAAKVEAELRLLWRRSPVFRGSMDDGPYTGKERNNERRRIFTVSHAQHMLSDWPTKTAGKSVKALKLRVWEAVKQVRCHPAASV